MLPSLPLIAALLVAADRAPPPRPPLARCQIERIDRWIEANLDEGIQIEQLAELVNLSRSHFSRSFQRTLGETPLAYVHRRRVGRAQQLMLTTRRSLAQIAIDCGLSDQCHLTRVFRRVTGTTPAHWRRTHGG